MDLLADAVPREQSDRENQSFPLRICHSLANVILENHVCIRLLQNVRHAAREQTWQSDFGEFAVCTNLAETGIRKILDRESG